MQVVSTRNVAAITAALFGTSIAESQISALVERLGLELTAAAHPYLAIDARYEHAC